MSMCNNKFSLGYRHSFKSLKMNTILLICRLVNIISHPGTIHRQLIHYKKLSVNPLSLPIISLSIYTFEGCLNKMMLSSVLSINP